MKSVIDYKIAFFLICPVISMLLQQDSVFAEFVQGQRKKQRAGMHLIQCYILGSDCDCAMVLTSHFIFFYFYFLCTDHSVGCAKDGKFLFSVLTEKEIMLCWQPSVPGRGLKMKGFETLMGLWGSSCRGIQILGAACCHSNFHMPWYSHIIMQSCAVIILMVLHSLGAFKLCPSSYWPIDLLSYLLVSSAWILLVFSQTHTGLDTHTERNW